MKSITLSDVFPITGVFVKVGKTFGDFIGRFISWIGTALWNLLENASKYAPVGGAIDIYGWRQGDKAQLAVTDDGPRILTAPA